MIIIIQNILILLEEYSYISLYCLLKHYYISYKIFDYFKCETIYYNVFLFITFYITYYLKENINLKNISKYIGNYYVSPHFKSKFGKDIKALKYIIIINICNNIKYYYYYAFFT